MVCYGLNIGILEKVEVTKTSQLCVQIHQIVVEILKIKLLCPYCTFYQYSEIVSFVLKDGIHGRIYRECGGMRNPSRNFAPPEEGPSSLQNFAPP